VYCRFVLQHLNQPVDLLSRMWSAVRPGGVLVVEDADIDTFCCHPPNEAFDFFLRTYGQVLKRRGPLLGANCLAISVQQAFHVLR
jgi:2-polyprenyl-3-methyl-5-hydroxy-6-metoxy-1,4-benzoquinol methylase